jgi:hypothetical protein
MYSLTADQRGFVMRMILTAILAPALALALTMTIDDFNVEYGLSASYDHSPGGTWAGWDETATSWDFGSVSGGNVVTVNVVSPSGQPGAASFPSAQYCEVVDNPSVDPVYSYFSVVTNFVVQYGFHTTVSGYVIDAVYAPPRNVYVFPMGVGDSWSSSYTYSYTIMGLPVNCQESHNVSVVGEGGVRTPASAPGWWACLVFMDYSTYSDNWGNNEARYTYTWAVPNGFAGCNEAVAIQSAPGAAPTFTSYDNRFVVTSTTATPDPWVELGRTTWGDIKATAW